MTFFRDTRRVLEREVRRIIKYPVYSTIMFILPVVSFLFFAEIFSVGVASNMDIALLDEDKTSLSRTLASMINDTPSAHVSYEVSDMLEAEELIKKGKVRAVVQIPHGFEKDILSNTKTRVAAYISGLNVTANGLLNKDIQLAATTFSTGIQLQVLMAQGLSEEQAYNQALPVYFDSHILFNPYVNYGYYLLPSFMPMMLMIFTIILTVFAIGTELKNSTAGEWFRVAGGSTAAALTGKLMPYTLTLFVFNLFMNTIMYKWLEVPLNGSAGMLIIAGFMFVLAYQSIAVLIISLLANLRRSLSIGGGYSVLAFTFSGLTFPLMAMDPWLRVASYIFPFTLYTEVFIDQAMRGAPIIYSVGHLGWLSLYIILPMLCLPRLKQVATDPKFWGKI